MEFAHLDARESTVSFASPLDCKEQVRQAVDIVDLVGKYIQLRRQGRNYVGLCPWHDDTKPSLQVNPQRQSFKCWVCDIGGDVFSFVMQIEGVEFREALEMLADQAGISLEPVHRPKRSPSSAPSQTAAPADSTSGEGKRALYRAMAWVEKQYHECLLNSPDAEPARRYLAERGISAVSVRKFHLGFSPVRRDWLLGLAGGSNSRARTLEAIGVLAQLSGRAGLLRSISRPRAVLDPRCARSAGWHGWPNPARIGSGQPRQVHQLAGDPLFSKSKLLYGLDVAREAIRKSRTALVMEGYTDCIVAHQSVSTTPWPCWEQPWDRTTCGF